MRYDVTLKDLFQQVPQQLVQTLVGCPIREVLTLEYPAVKTRRPDLVARLADDRLYHIEFQTNNDPNIAWRMQSMACSPTKYRSFNKYSTSAKNV